MTKSDHILEKSRVSPGFDKCEVVDFYQKRYAQSYMDEWPIEKKKRVYQLIRDLGLPNVGKAIDFGCGNGVLTNVIKQALPQNFQKLKRWKHMILIAGGAGYIGSHANKILNKRGYETVVYDNLSRGHREFAKWGHFVLGDLADKDQLRLCFKTYPIEAVMHYCAFCYVGESVDHPAEYYRNNVVNTLNLLDVMVEFGVKYFIFSSTCSTYGNPLQIPMTEDHPQQPINPYGKSKLMVEQILKDYDYTYGIRHVCLRYFNAAGADPEGEIGEWHDPEPHLIPLSLQAAAGQRVHIQIYGTDYDTPDGTCIRDYIHINDLAAGHLLAL